MKTSTHRTIGVISDTHGLLRAEAIAALQGVELILHSGDMGSLSVLDQLAAIAPAVAVRGNVDRSGGTEALPATEAVEFAGHWFYLLHNLDELDLDPQAAGFSAVIHGHSHQPKLHYKDKVLYFNPGSAGPCRFKLPICLGILQVEEGGITGNWIDLG